VTPAPHSMRFRTPVPDVLVAISLPPSLIAPICSIVGDRADVRAVSQIADAVHQLDGEMSSCLLLAVPSDEQATQTAALHRLRGAYPHVPAVALFSPRVSSYRAALQLGASGVTELVTVDPLPAPEDLLSSLSRCHADGIAVRVWRHAALEMPEALVPVLKAAIRLAHEPLTTVRLAAATGMHERSLRKYCESARLPSPQWLIGWARLLIAGYYLDEPGRSVVSVAEMLAFPSTCALRNQLRRYTGLAPSTLRARGTSVSLARLLEQTIRDHRDSATVETHPRAYLRLVR
jgi:AraC-like DNA-binding protein